MTTSVIHLHDKLPPGEIETHSNNNISTQLDESQTDQNDGHHKESSTGHTDSENEDEQIHTKVDDTVNKNVTFSPDSTSIHPGAVPEVTGKVRTRTSSARSNSPRNDYHLRKFSQRFDGAETDSDTDIETNISKRSYLKYKMRRKALLKIEKLTDSDSRNRAKMKSRALSPPSSSDEENLYIGWVAYPISPSLTSSERKLQQRNRQHVVCACVTVLKCLFSPVYKVCHHMCRNNKVKDGSLTYENHFENQLTM